jgi:transcriptional regulator with XRE-family HTH domain
VTDDHLESLGFAVISTGWLRQLRPPLRLSRRRLAEILGVSTQTVLRWEEPGTRIWSGSAVQIGQFYVDIIEHLDAVIELGPMFKHYLPASEMASYLAKPTFVVEKMCEAGELDCLDLGRLGMYVKQANTSSSSG